MTYSYTNSHLDNMLLHWGWAVARTILDDVVEHVVVDDNTRRIVCGIFTPGKAPKGLLDDSGRMLPIDDEDIREWIRDNARSRLFDECVDADYEYPDGEYPNYDEAIKNEDNLRDLINGPLKISIGDDDICRVDYDYMEKYLTEFIKRCNETLRLNPKMYDRSGNYLVADCYGRSASSMCHRLGICRDVYEDMIDYMKRGEVDCND